MVIRSGRITTQPFFDGEDKTQLVLGVVWHEAVADEMSESSRFRSCEES